MARLYKWEAFGEEVVVEGISDEEEEYASSLDMATLILVNGRGFGEVTRPPLRSATQALRKCDVLFMRSGSVVFRTSSWERSQQRSGTTHWSTMRMMSVS